MAVAAKVVAAALLALVVLSVSIVGVLRGSRPVAALAWSPHDAAALARWAGLSIDIDNAPANRPRVRQIAEATLRRDATEVEAWRALALVADAEGDHVIARRRFAIVERLTKRDQPTHVWLIGEFTRAGQTSALMRQLDMALRTSSTNADQLLPLLVAITADPNFVEPLAREVSARPNWRDQFMGLLVATGPDLVNAARLTGELDPADPSERVWIGVLLKRMADAREFDLAWRYHAKVMGQAGARPAPKVRDGNFEGDALYPFGWMLVDEPDLSARRGARPGSKGNSLLLAADDGKSGSVARQLLALPPGIYRLSARAGGLPAEARDRPALQLACAGSDALLARIQPGGADGEGNGVVVSATARVPGGCAWQWLSVEFAGNGPPPLEVPWVDDIDVVRVAN